MILSFFFGSVLGGFFGFFLGIVMMPSSDKNCSSLDQ